MLLSTRSKIEWLAAWSFLFCLFIPSLIYAQDFSLNGTLRGYYFNSTRDLDEETDIFGASFQPRATLKFAPYLTLYSELRFIAEKPWNGIYSSLREGYGDIYLNSLDFRIGKQIIQWGRADGINPTDNLTPWNYTLLFSEDSQLRSGVIALRSNYYYKNTAFTGIWIPFFEPNRFPLPPNYQVTEVTPSETLENSQYAFKIDSTGGILDWSLSYFDGFDPMPDLALSTTGIILRYPRIRVIGGDFAATLGKFGIRGEAAYFFTEDMDGDNPEKKNPYLFYVLGVDRTLWEYLYLNLQFIQRIVTNYKNPMDIQNPYLRDVAVRGAVINNQLDRITNAISLKIAYKMFHETLNLELSGIYNITRRDYLIRPKVSYAFTDHLSGIIGADIYEGRVNTLFGLLEDNTTFFAELKYGF